MAFDAQSFLTAIRIVVETAGSFLLVQGALSLLLGAQKDRNLVYQFVRIVTRPAIAAACYLLPRRFPMRFVPVVTFSLLFVLWVSLAYLRRASLAN